MDSLLSAGHTPWDVITVVLVIGYFVYSARERKRDRERERNKHEENKKLIAQVVHEVKPNSGSSMADAINRTESGLKELTDTVGVLTEKFDEEKALDTKYRAWIDREIELDHYESSRRNGRSKRRAAHR